MTYPLGNDLALWREGSTRLFVLNATAQVIWQGHNQGLTAAAIAQQLVAHFAVPFAQAEQDTQAALAHWQHADLFSAAKDATEVFPVSESQEPLPPLPSPSADVVYQLGGLNLRVRYGEAHLHTVLQPLLQHLSVAVNTPADSVFDLIADPTGAGYLLGRDGVVVIRRLSLDDLVAHTLYQLLICVCQQAPALALFHAAAVADVTTCLIMPGLGGSGKSTLTAALLTEGFDYLGDDIIMLSRDELPRAWALPSPLCLKAGSWTVLKPYYPDFEQLPVWQRRDQPVRYLVPSRVTSQQRWPIHGLLFPTYQPAHPAQLDELSSSEALQLLIASNTQLRQPLTTRDVRVLMNWLDRTPAYRLVYEQLPDAIAAVRRVMTL